MLVLLHILPMGQFEPLRCMAIFYKIIVIRFTFKIKQFI